MIYCTALYCLGSDCSRIYAKGTRFDLVTLPDLISVCLHLPQYAHHAGLAIACDRLCVSWAVTSSLSALAVHTPSYPHIALRPSFQPLCFVHYKNYIVCRLNSINIQNVYVSRGSQVYRNLSFVVVCVYGKRLGIAHWMGQLLHVGSRRSGLLWKWLCIGDPAWYDGWITCVCSLCWCHM